jgi:plasmid maintenance system antidote protein VapI
VTAKGQNGMAAKRYETIESILRRKIKASGMTRYELAKVCEIDQGTLGRFVAKKAPIHLKNANKLAKYFGMELQEVAT